MEKLNWLLSQRLDLQSAMIRVQNPVRLSVDSEPQPDIAVVRFREDFYRLRHPGPEEILLLIEVADTALETDRAVKAPLYARAGVAETWLVDLDGASVEVFRRPGREGYEVHHTLRADDRLVPEKLPRAVLRVSEVLGDS